MEIQILDGETPKGAADPAEQVAPSTQEMDYWSLRIQLTSPWSVEVSWWLVSMVTIMCRNDELSWVVSGVGFLLTD